MPLGVMNVSDHGEFLAHVHWPLLYFLSNTEDTEDTGTIAALREMVWSL